MKELISFLEENRIGAFATVEDGLPRVRPWGFMLAEGGRLYFSTANTKKVYAQLCKNPAFEFTSTSKDMVTVRISGKAQFIKDRTIKEKVLEALPMVKSIYGKADNPIFEVFCIEHGEASFSDFSGNPPRCFSF